MLRIVVREGFSADLARALRDDALTALAHLDELKPAATSTGCSPSLTSPGTCPPDVLGQSAVGDMSMQTTELSLTPSAAAEAIVDLDAIAHTCGCCASRLVRLR